MSASITYSEFYSDYTIQDYLSDWSYNFSNANHGASNPGGFNQTNISGTQYGTTAYNNAYSFIAEGDFEYFWTPTLPMNDPNNHVLNGDLDGVQFGYGLSSSNGSSKPTTYSLDDFEVSFNGLDLSSTGQSGEVHQVLWGLMNGNTSALLDILEDLFSGALTEYNTINGTNLDFTDLTFEQWASVGAATELPSSSASSYDSELVGIPEAEDYLLAA